MLQRTSIMWAHNNNNRYVLGTHFSANSNHPVPCPGHAKGTGIGEDGKGQTERDERQEMLQ